MLQNGVSPFGIDERRSIFDSAGNKPIFDIVCVDEKNLAFEIDQIR